VSKDKDRQIKENQRWYILYSLSLSILYTLCLSLSILYTLSVYYILSVSLSILYTLSVYSILSLSVLYTLSQYTIYSLSILYTLSLSILYTLCLYILNCFLCLSHDVCIDLYSHKVIEQIETRNSQLKEELVEVKEQLNKTLLDRDCLQQEQSDTASSLSKVELQNAELGM